MADEPVGSVTGLSGTPGRRGSRRWLVVAVPVLLIAVAAFLVVQGGGDGGGPLNAIAKAAEVTQKEPGGRAKFHVDVTSASTPEGLTEEGSMTFDDSGRTRSTVRAKGKSTGKEGELLSITDGFKSYMSSELFTTLPPGKKWMEIDFSAAAKASSGSPGSTQTQTDPQNGLKILEKVIGAEKVGRETVDGVPTTRYTGTLPTAEEVFGVKPDISDSTIEVWIDAKDRVRRMHLDITGGIKGNSATTATTAMTIDFVEFGRVPKIAVPPADEVVDVTGELEGNLQAAAGE